MGLIGPLGVATGENLYPARITTPPTLGESHPLCFLHIAKTGGTSLKDALARLYAPEQLFSDEGYLSVAYLDSLGDRLAGRVFLAGHPNQGVACYLKGRADMITVLRRPADQAVSQYLFALSHPKHPLHAQALHQSFSEYLRRNEQQIDYQALSLAVALGGNPEESDALRMGESAVMQFLDSLPFVGVMERMETNGVVLSHLAPGGGVIDLPCLNAAVYRGISVRTVEKLRREYEDLRADPQLAPIFAREARLHTKAVERLEALSRAVIPPGPRRRGFLRPAMVGARRFDTAHGRVLGPAITAPLEYDNEPLVYGPYDVLPVGHYAVEFQFSVEDAGVQALGRIEIEAFSNGALCLAQRWLGPGAWSSQRSRTLSFTNLDTSNVLEFRIRAEGFTRGRLVFKGVTLRSQARHGFRRWFGKGATWQTPRAETLPSSSPGTISARSHYVRDLTNY
jgi:hypothetical protein